MRLIKRLLAALLIVIVIAVVVAYFLPREVAVARTTRINAPAAEIFPHVNSMQATEAWSPWLDRDPDVVLNYGGPDSGAGNTLTWASDHPQVGNGTQTITASEENASVLTDLDFGDMGTAIASITLEEADGGTDVTWGFVTDMGMNPISRYFGLMMDGWVGGDYERGLANLKALVEAG